MIFTLLLCCTLGYLLGSIPFGLLFTRLAGTVDIRTLGSGNIGATNVLRTGHKGLAALTLAADMTKGVVTIILSVFLISWLMPYAIPDLKFCNDGTTTEELIDRCQTSMSKMEYILFLAGAAAVIGHMFPIWLRYKGGKGVATFFGVILGYVWMVGLLALGTWVVVAILSKRSSVAALMATTLTPVYMVLLHLDQLFTMMWSIIACVMLVALIWYQHRENIKRLRAGSEPKIGQT